MIAAENSPCGRGIKIHQKMGASNNRKYLSMAALLCRQPMLPVNGDRKKEREKMDDKANEGKRKGNGRPA